MKIISVVFLGLALFVSAAHADTKLYLPEPGQYKFNGQISMEIHKHHEVVYAITKEGQAQLDKLRAQEFACEHKGRSTFLCWKFLPVEGAVPSDELKNRVNQHFAAGTMEIFERKGDPELTWKGESFEEYRLQQKIILGGKKTYEFCRYQISQGLHKIALGEPAEAGFVIEEDGTYSQGYTFTKTLSKTSYDLYMFSGIFVKK